MKQKFIAGLLVVLMLLIVSCGKTEEPVTTPETGETEPEVIETEEAEETPEAESSLPKHDTLVAEIGDRQVTKDDFNKSFLFQKLSVLNAYGEKAFEGDEGKILTENLRNKVQQDLAKEQVFSILAENAGIQQDMEKAEEVYNNEFLAKNTEETLKYFEDNNLDKDFVKARIALETQIGDFVGMLHKEVEESDGFKELKESVKLVRARHILLPEAEEEKAKELKAQLDEDPSLFEALAKEYSQDTSAERGGDLGYFSKEEMVPEFSDAAYSLEVDQVSEPIKSQFGWHIIQTTEKGTLAEIAEKAEEDEAVKRLVLKHTQAEVIKMINERSAEQEAKTPIKYYSLED